VATSSEERYLCSYECQRGLRRMWSSDDLRTGRWLLVCIFAEDRSDAEN
jgi:hypothetical protein